MSAQAELVAVVTAYLEHRETGERYAIYHGDGAVPVSDLLACVTTSKWRLVLVLTCP